MKILNGGKIIIILSAVNTIKLFEIQSTLKRDSTIFYFISNYVEMLLLPVYFSLILIIIATKCKNHIKIR